jgi:DNA replication protein DnaC
MPTPQSLNLDFKTFGDPELVRLLDASQKWLEGHSRNGAPHWCSLLGSSGTGKTFLAKQCKNKIRQLGLDWYAHKITGISQYRLMRWFYWPKFVRRLRGGEYGLVDAAIDADILFIDDIGAEYRTDYAVGALTEICDQRLSKWTFITSNLGLDGIAGEVDPRVASRMLRGENTVAETSALDFSLR